MQHYRTKKLGQVFLTNREVAIAEAEHSHGKRVLEIGPGHGMLTRELCERAESVVAVEKDKELYDELRRGLTFKNLRLINADFLKVNEEQLKSPEIDIVISNVPYSISSEIIKWIADNQIEAVLCLQKEFVERMLSKEGTRNYSRLSVFCSLCLSITEIMEVPSTNFNPRPDVDSAVIYVKPRKETLSKDQEETINALMQHKKQTVRKALISARASFNATKEEMDRIAEKTGMQAERVFMLSPTRLLKLADDILRIQKELYGS